MPFPVAHGMIGASIIAASGRNFSLNQGWKPLLLGAALAICPDFDFFFPWVLHLGWHRGFSHSIAFALLVSLLNSALLGKFKTKETIVYGLAVISHDLLDFLSTKSMAGVELLWPLSNHRFKLGLFDYPEFYVDPRFQTLTDSGVNMLKMSLIESLVFAPLLVTILFIRADK